LNGGSDDEEEEEAIDINDHDKLFKKFGYKEKQ
jgi:hypothetical protein